MCLFSTPSCEREAEPGTTRLPDVILITLDTTRADHLGVYGYSRATSPALDAFAKEAIVFERAWSTAPWTLPAHASMITGKYPTSHGAHYARETGDASISDVLPFVPSQNFRANRLPESQRTLAEILADEGYATAAFAGGHWLAPEFGLLQGYAHQNAHVPELAGRPAAELNEAAIEWMQSIPASRPIHLLINYFDPHDPYTPEPGNRLPPEGLVSELPAEIAEMVDAYDAEIHYMDRHIGSFLDALRALGRYEDALIVIVADHGELFGEHGLTNHGPWLHEELVRVPLLIRLPGGREGGTRSRASVSIVDLLPVVAREVGFDLPEDIEGSLPGSRTMVVAESRSSGFHVRKLGTAVDRDLRAAIEWPWKIIVGSNGEIRFYRLDLDPGESQALETDPRAHEMRAALEELVGQLQPPTSGTSPGEVSPETEENLRALGYIE
jgi:arylsulfatase A-like enzyme